MAHDDEATVRELLRPHDPAPDGAAGRPVVAFERLDRPERRIRRGFPARPLIGLGLAISLTAVLLMAGSGDEPPGSFGIERSVAVRSAAEAGTPARPTLVSAAEKVSPAGSGPVAYSRIVRGSLDTVGGDEPYSFWQPQEVSTWIGPDGRVLVRSVRGEAWFAGRRDRERAGNGGAVPDAGETDRVELPAGTPSVFGDLPLDPGPLERRMREDTGGGTDVDYRIFKRIQELLLDPGLTPAQTAALYRVASRLPGATLTGEVTDQLRRPGVSIGLDTEDRTKRTELILDPRTGALLQSREVLLVAAPFVDAEPPTVLSFDVIVARGRVSRIGEAPSSRRSARAGRRPAGPSAAARSASPPGRARLRTRTPAAPAGPGGRPAA